jgi:hypothetical protein
MVVARKILARLDQLSDDRSMHSFAACDQAAGAWLKGEAAHRPAPAMAPGTGAGPQGQAAPRAGL